MSIEKIPILPGGQLADLVETALGKTQHQEVVNLRQTRIGEWDCVEGYKNVLIGFTNVKAAIEITEDQSGDRFYLIQDDTDLCRVDYNITNSPDFGYENETPSILTLPSGVTIASDAVLRFFYFRGVVRITGASEPLWYGYIKRTLFPNSWSIPAGCLKDFNTASHGLVNINSTIVQETVSPLLEGAGTVQITANATDGYGYELHTVVVGTRYKFFIKGYKVSGQTSTTFRVRMGTTQGGSEYISMTHTIADEWHVFEHEITATGTSLYISLSPVTNGDYAHFDYYLLRRNHQIDIDGWYLYKAALTKPTKDEVLDIELRPHGALINSVGYLHALGAIGLGYDGSQYSLIWEGIDFTIPSGFNLLINNINRICSGGYATVEADIEIDRVLNDLYRITSILLASYYKVGTGAVVDPEPGEYRVQEELDFTEEYEKGWVFAKANCHLVGTNRLNLWQVTDVNQRWWDGLFQVGRRIKLANSFGSYDTIITVYNEDYSNDQNHYIEVLEPDITDIGAADTDIEELGIWIEKVWDYTGSGYKMRTAFELEMVGEGTYPEVTDTPDGTINNTPDYSHHVIIEERAYVASKEEEEEDAIRFSPIMQFDNFPISNLIQTQVGDIDQTRAIEKRGGRLVMLKRNSISQGNFVGGSYYEDIGLHDSGLYSLYGYYLIDDILYYLDREEVYAFYGQRPVALMVSEYQRKIYRERVNENSLIFYDKIHNEIWFVLKGGPPGGSILILIYHPERKEWYTRDTDGVPVCSFMDYDKNMIVAFYDKLVTWNHSEIEYDEDVTWSFKTKLFSDGKHEFLKKVNSVHFLGSCNYDIDVISSDPDSATSRTKTFTPGITAIVDRRVKPLFVFKSLDIELTSETEPDMVAKIRRLEIEVETWK